MCTSLKRTNNKLSHQPSIHSNKSLLAVKTRMAGASDTGAVRRGYYVLRQTMTVEIIYNYSIITVF